VIAPAHYPSLSQPERRTLRLAYIEAQAGRCALCEAPLSGPTDPRIAGLPVDWSLFPPGFTKHPIHLHHDHETGMTLGAVHALCNALSWQYHGE
jgi:hypothetical protein